MPGGRPAPGTVTPPRAAPGPMHVTQVGPRNPVYEPPIDIPPEVIVDPPNWWEIPIGGRPGTEIPIGERPPWNPPLPGERPPSVIGIGGRTTYAEATAGLSDLAAEIRRRLMTMRGVG